MKIVLVGYMGSGKSIVAKKLSERLKISFADLDFLIEKEANKPIKKIFDEKGELFFRKLEHKIFKEVLNQKEPIVISTGGGTPCYYDNYKLYDTKNCFSIYLKATIETLSKRLFIEKEKRPIIANFNREELENFIAPHLFERSFYYNKSKLIITVDKKTVDEIVEDIFSKLT